MRIFPFTVCTVYVTRDAETLSTDPCAEGFINRKIKVKTIYQKNHIMQINEGAKWTKIPEIKLRKDQGTRQHVSELTGLQAIIKASDRSYSQFALNVSYSGNELGN